MKNWILKTSSEGVAAFDVAARGGAVGVGQQSAVRVGEVGFGQQSAARGREVGLLQT